MGKVTVEIEARKTVYYRQDVEMDKDEYLRLEKFWRENNSDKLAQELIKAGHLDEYDTAEEDAVEEATMFTNDNPLECLDCEEDSDPGDLLMYSGRCQACHERFLEEGVED